MLSSLRARTALATTGVIAVVVASAAASAAAPVASGVSQGPRCDLQRVAQPQLRRSAPLGPLHAEQCSGEYRRGDHPARPARRAADQRVRLRRRTRAGRALPAELPRRSAERGRAPIAYPLLLHRAVEHRRPVRLRPRQQRRSVGGPERRASGSAFFPGQFGMAVFSQVPDRHGGRADVPEVPLEGHAGRAACRTTRTTPAPADWYSPAELAIFRLSSKSHWDLPIEIGKKTVHFLVSHPTPPVFDGPEDRNGTRNHDEIRFWADYITPGKSGYIYDDARHVGGLKPGSPVRDRGRPELRSARRRQHPGIDPATPRASARQHEAHAVQPRRRGAGRVAGRRERHAPKRPRLRHGRLRRLPAPGNLRADYVLPSEEHRDRRCRRLLAAVDRPALRTGRRLPVPFSSDHRARLDRRRSTEQLGTAKRRARSSSIEPSAIRTIDGRDGAGLARAVPIP